MASSDALSLGLDDIIQMNRRGGRGGSRGFRGRGGRGSANGFRTRGGGGIVRCFLSSSWESSKFSFDLATSTRSRSLGT